MKDKQRSYKITLTKQQQRRQIQISYNFSALVVEFTFGFLASHIKRRKQEDCAVYILFFSLVIIQARMFIIMSFPYQNHNILQHDEILDQSYEYVQLWISRQLTQPQNFSRLQARAQMCLICHPWQKKKRREIEMESGWIIFTHLVKNILSLSFVILPQNISMWGKLHEILIRIRWGNTSNYPSMSSSYWTVYNVLFTVMIILVSTLGTEKKDRQLV